MDHCYIANMVSNKFLVISNNFHSRFIFGQERFPTVNYFCKKLHFRCFTLFWIRLWRLYLHETFKATADVELQTFQLSTLTVSLSFSRSHGGFFISHGFTKFSGFSLKLSFLGKQTRQHNSFSKKYRSMVLCIQKN